MNTGPSGNSFLPERISAFFPLVEKPGFFNDINPAILANGGVNSISTARGNQNFRLLSLMPGPMVLDSTAERI